MTEAKIRSDIQTYYSAPAAMSDPGEFAACFNDLPDDVPGLVKALQGLTIHIFWAERYGIKHTDERQSEVTIRPVQRKLARLLELDPRPLNEARTLERKLVSNCRDFSLLCSSMLRHKGIPARVRCGFGTYFMPDHYEDHWVVEYWKADEARWAWLDAQMDDLQKEVLKIGFNTLDMPAGQFVTGGDAWLRCRRQGANPDDFGIFQYHGWDFVKGNLFRDLLALNKFEVLPWDNWSALEPEYAAASPEQLAFFDQVAEVTLLDNDSFPALRSFYKEHTHLHAPVEWAA